MKMRRVSLLLVFIGCLLVLLGITSIPFARQAELWQKDKTSMSLLAYLHAGENINSRRSEGWIAWSPGEYLEIYNGWVDARPDKVNLLTLYYDLSEEEIKVKKELEDMTVVIKGPMTIIYMPSPLSNPDYLLNFDPAATAPDFNSFRKVLRKIAHSDYNHAMAFGRSHGYNPLFFLFLIRGGFMSASYHLLLESFFAYGGKIHFAAISWLFAGLGISILGIGVYWMTSLSRGKTI